MKAQFNQLLEDQKKRVKNLERQVGHAKMSYAEALRNLEQISDEIHRVSCKCKLKTKISPTVL
jgi:flagellar biosynthesis chaperone FliJ